jgi:putative ABC transport system substrate-binding protein
MRRRDLIKVFGGGAIAWPLTARAQQTAVPVVGLLDQRSPEELADRLHGFRQGLRDSGFVEGQIVAVLVSPANANYAEATLNEVGTSAHSMGLQIQVLKASTIPEINAAFATLAAARPDALFVGHDPFFNSRRTHLVQLAARYAVPASYSARDFAEAGGLMSYGANIADAWRQAGSYAGSILKGAKPADLPVVQSNKFELVINNQTATMFGLTVPPSLLAIADEVIE